jgi:hypothetical protein
MAELESKFLEAAKTRRSKRIEYTTSDDLKVTLRAPEYKETLKLYENRDTSSSDFLVSAAEILADCMLSPSLDSKQIRLAMMDEYPGQYPDDYLIPRIDVLYYLFPNPMDIIAMITEMETTLSPEAMKQRLETAKNS